jgi:hypothetical protein
MKVRRAIQIRNQQIQRLRELIILTKSVKMTSQELYERKRRIMNDVPNRFPRWAAEYVDGYFECMYDRLWYEDLEFCYVDAANNILSVERDSDRYYEDMGYEPRDLKELRGAHYWKESDRPFTKLLNLD